MAHPIKTARHVNTNLAPRQEDYFGSKIFPRTKHLPVAFALLAITLFAANFTVSQLAQAQTAKPQSQQPAQLQDPANLTGERVSPQDPADTLPLNHGSPALQQLLLKLRTRASFMLIVAHPDDEDGGLLTYLSRGQGARVAMLTLNRGEGGQNLMSADFDDALGLIRTQELLAADRYMGVDQFFGTEVDFGFSKTKEESFAKWTNDRVLYDAVRAVRLYRPLVIASVFIGGPTDGHGQHQVAGQIAQEVFNAAGDPKVFPDQIAAGLQPWQPLKVYARVPNARIATDESGAQTMYDSATNQYVPARFTNYVTGRVSTTLPQANVVIPEGDPATYTAPNGSKTPIPGMEGLSYVQFAGEGRAMQKTQFGPNPRQATPGPHDVSYHRYASRIPAPNNKTQPEGNEDLTLEPSLFTGIDTSLPGIAILAPEASDKFHPLLEKIDSQIAEAQRLFNPDDPELTAPPLRLALVTLDQLLHELEDPNINDLDPIESYNLLHELRIKRVQLNNALILALGISLEATSSAADFAAGSTIKFQTSLTQPAPDSLPHVMEGSANGTAGGLSDGVSSNGAPPVLSNAQPIFHDCSLGTDQTPVTRPYFSRKQTGQAFYDIADAALRNAPATPAALICFAQGDFDGVPLSLGTIVGNANQPLSYVLPVSIQLSRTTAILRPGEAKVTVVATVHADDTIQKLGGVKVSYAHGEDSKPEVVETAFPTESRKIIGKDEQVVIAATASVLDRHPSTLSAVVTSHGHDYSEGYRAVGYPGLPYTNYYTPATTRIVPVDVTTAPHLHIAYLPGTGDDISTALEDLGIKAHILATADLTPTALKSYDAVILGVRANEVRTELGAVNMALNTYASNGGIVIAQYVSHDWPPGSAPFPLSLGANEKVVEEDAPVQILAPSDPLLAWPNKITSADFDDWIEERGHGFMSTWDPHYTALVETHDHGQQPQRGGLLVARTGRGAWIYLGLALYRQLPEGVPGAYRILANLISAAKNPGLQK